MPREVRNPDTLFNSLQYGFSQIAIGQGSRIVMVSGQVGWDAAQQIDADFRAQTMTAFKNLDSAMRAAGGTLDDILFLHIYIVESAMHDSSVVQEGLKAFFPSAPPATTWVGVPRLANPAFLIEIEAMAILA